VSFPSSTGETSILVAHVDAVRANRVGDLVAMQLFIETPYLRQVALLHPLRTERVSAAPSAADEEDLRVLERTTKDGVVAVRAPRRAAAWLHRFSVAHRAAFAKPL
jgi:hypothetical protein